MKKVNITKIIVSVIYLLSFFFLNAYISGMFEMETAKEVVGECSDGFVIPGLIYICIGGLTWVAKLGFFDAISYGFISLKYLFSPSKRALEGRKTYYDYKTEKDSKERIWHPYFIYYGLIMCGIGVVLFLIYLCL